MARHSVTGELTEKVVMKVFDEVESVVVSGVESLLSVCTDHRRCCSDLCFRRILFDTF
jgi:hypothetical protein